MRVLSMFVTLLVQVVLFSQNKEKININHPDSLKIFLEEKQKKIDSLKKIDFIDMTYKSLDSDFNIKINENEFEKIIYEKSKILENYKDSLMVILYYELGDYDAVNIAFHRILFNWKKMSYYIWESELKTKEIGESFGFKHPYRFFKFLKNSNTENSKKIEFLIQLKSKLSEKVSDTINLKPYDKFLRYTFRHNPERIKYMKEYRRKHSKNKN